MQSDEIRQKVQQIFEDVMDLDDVALSDDTTANDVEEWDSLSHVRLIVSIEKAYGIKFTNSEIESLRKFGDILMLIEQKISA